MKPDKEISAQVVLVAASGARINSHTRITSENVNQWLPSAETVVKVSGELKSKGFVVGQCVGNSMSITGQAKIFESYFNAKLRDVKGGVQFAGSGFELPTEKIPTALRTQLVAVTFTPPPDFGPGATASFE